MIKIDTWNWRYKVSFDVPLYEKIEKSINEISHPSSQKIMIDLLNIFSEKLSVSELVKHCLNEVNDVQSALDAASRATPLFLPNFLSEEFCLKVRKSQKLKKTEKNELIGIIKSANETPFYNIHREIFESIFGSYLDTLLKNSVDEIAPPVKKLDISDKSILEVSKIIIRSLDDITPPFLKEATKFIPNYEIEVKFDKGFAEYWPKSLTNLERDKLVIYDNNEHQGFQDLQATIAHEILGHATFYNFIKEFNPPFFDHGSIAFVEGWATWCEWITSNQEHAEHLRSSRCQSLKTFDYLSTTKIQNHIIDATSQKGYSKNFAKASIEYFFQYPGFRLSYTLGAVWFEHRLTNLKPLEFFDSIKNEPWGDFFALW